MLFQIHRNSTVAFLELQEFNSTYIVEVAACTQAGAGMVSPRVWLFVPENSKRPCCFLSPHLIILELYNLANTGQPMWCAIPLPMKIWNTASHVFDLIRQLLWSRFFTNTFFCLLMWCTHSWHSVNQLLAHVCHQLRLWTVIPLKYPAAAK